MKLPALIAALLIPCASLAQSRVTIPVQDPVYRDIDRLVALRLVEVGLYGQRPYSRREFARLTREAAASVQTREVSAATRGIVRRLRDRFSAEVRQLEKVESLRTGSAVMGTSELIWLSSQERAIPPDETGRVNSALNPITGGRTGREYREGGRPNLAAEPRWEFQSKRLGAVLHPRVLKAQGETDVTWEAASVSIPIRNLTVEAGRQPIVWGQGMEGGLMFSSSGKPLDMLRISTDLPFLGWFIKGTSPMRGSIVAAHLGRNQHFPNSYLIAYKLSGHPFTNRVELAASVLGVQGGRGAPPGSFVDHAMDLIPIFKYLLSDNTVQFSNKMAGWEYRLRIPEWSGLQLYAEHAFEDMDPRRWASTFWEDGGHILGVSLNDLGPGGAASAAWEYHRTGLRFYKHGVFLSGMTFNGTLFGDPLGNQGDGGYMRLGWDRGGTRRLGLDVALERRDGDSYRALSDGPDEDNFRFQMYQSVPAEWRSRVIGSYRFGPAGEFAITGGFERVRDFAFVRGDNRNNYLIGVALGSFR
jgi:hypothetical protein